MTAILETKDIPVTPVAAALVKAGVVAKPMSKRQRIWRLLHDRGASTAKTISSIMGCRTNGDLCTMVKIGLLSVEHIRGRECRYQALGRDYFDLARGRTAAPPKPAKPTLTPRPTLVKLMLDLPGEVRALPLPTLYFVHQTLTRLFEE